MPILIGKKISYSEVIGRLNDYHILAEGNFVSEYIRLLTKGNDLLAFLNGHDTGFGPNRYSFKSIIKDRSLKVKKPSDGAYYEVEDPYGVIIKFFKCSPCQPNYGGPSMHIRYNVTKENFDKSLDAMIISLNRRHDIGSGCNFTKMLEKRKIKLFDLYLEVLEKESQKT